MWEGVQKCSVLYDLEESKSEKHIKGTEGKGRTKVSVKLFSVFDLREGKK
jgi:hypothetical protein